MQNVCEQLGKCRFNSYKIKKHKRSRRRRRLAAAARTGRTASGAPRSSIGGKRRRLPTFLRWKSIKVLKPHQNSIVEMLQCARIIFESSNLISKKIMNHIDNFHEPRGRLCWSFNSSVNRRRHGMKKLRHRRMRWLMSVLLVDQMSLGEGARGGNLAFRLYDGSNFKLANPKCELTILYQLCAAGLMLSKTSFRKSDQFQSLTVFFSPKLTFVRTKRSYFL